MMQILKGNIGKSVTIQHIIKNTNSICYVYYDMALFIDGSYFIDSNHPISEVISYFEDEYGIDQTDKLRDYFIVYTNKTQAEIQELIDWLDNNSHRLNAVCVLVTCRPDDVE